MVTSMNGEWRVIAATSWFGQAFGHDPFGELTTFGFVGDDTRGGWQIRADRPLEVERQVRVGFEVPDPTALAPARGAGDDDAAVDVVEDQLDAAGLAASPARGGDVDRVTPAQCALDGVVHGVLAVLVEPSTILALSIARCK
jgi:hypothetical protein